MITPEIGGGDEHKHDDEFKDEYDEKKCEIEPPIVHNDWSYDKWSAELLSAPKETINEMIRELYRKSGGDIRYEPIL